MSVRGMPLLGIGPGGWLREIIVNDADPGLLINQNGAGPALSLPSATTAAKGLILGGDVALYRSAADVLTIPDAVTLGGILSIPDGAVGAPALVFASDPDTGIYHFGATGEMAFATDGVYAFRIRPVSIAFGKPLDMSNNGLVNVNTLQMIDAGPGIVTGLVDDDLFYIGAVDNDTNTITNIARATGAAQPSFDLLLARFGTVPLAAVAANRGMLDFEEGAGGVADKLMCIMKSALDAYSRVQVAIG